MNPMATFPPRTAWAPSANRSIVHQHLFAAGGRSLPSPPPPPWTLTNGRSRPKRILWSGLLATVAVVGQIACTFRRRGRHSQWHDKVSGARQVSGYFGKLSNSADVVESVDTQDLKS